MWLLKALFISDWLAVFGSSKAAYKENCADRWDMMLARPATECYVLTSIFDLSSLTTQRPAMCC